MVLRLCNYVALCGRGIRKGTVALAGVAQWTEHWPVTKGKGTVLLPGLWSIVQEEAVPQHLP